MPSLSINLLPNILSSLEASDLEKCCLVTWSFHSVARQLLFSHLILSSTTWKAKCRVLLDAPDDHLLKVTKSLTLHIVGLLVIVLGANSDSIGDKAIRSDRTRILPTVKSISFGTFGTSDFDANTSLSQYLDLPETRVQSLSLAEYCSSDKFPVSLSFLEPFGMFTQQLLHLSFSVQLYDVIIASRGQYRILSLGMFPQLQTLQFAFSVRSYDSRKNKWTYWADWMTSLFTSEAGGPESLKIVRFLMHPSDELRPITSLDELATTLNLQIHICIDGGGSNVEQFEDTVISVRNSLPSWDGAGNLKFWMRLEE
ncbi:hypothetical protein DL96DRAFT_1781188 [Flagelloscypha sp. PMI_526]|nr:hypothetical protein DL96DRAFT_1781188 [Flagelloscypha sp. PMI_526]